MSRQGFLEPPFKIEMMGRQCSTDLSTVFEQVSRDTWKLLKRGRRTHLGIPEETVTTLNLLKLSEVRMRGFSVRSFSKRVERENGADWEWWFGRRGGTWLGFRVQAKVLNLNSDCFEHLHYGPRPGSRTQAEQLVRSAFESDPPRVPFYCLYSHWYKKQSYGGIQLPLNKPLHGCSIVSPALVHILHEEGKKNHLHDLFPAMRPWHKLVSKIPEHTEFADGIRTKALQLLGGDEHDKDDCAEEGLVSLNRGLELRVRRANREFFANALKIKPVRTPPTYVVEGFHDEFWRSPLAQSDPDPYLRGTTVVSVD